MEAKTIGLSVGAVMVPGQGPSAMVEDVLSSTARTAHLSHSWVVTSWVVTSWVSMSAFSFGKVKEQVRGCYVNTTRQIQTARSFCKVAGPDS